MVSSSSFGRRLLGSKILFLVSLFILIFFSVNLTREIINRRDLEKDIKKLEEEMGGLAARNQELGGLIEYFKTMDFVEEEARTKLNLRKPGEQIIIVPPEPLAGEPFLVSPLASLSGSEAKPSSNWERWLNYFFKIN
ncbi:MAG: hypothetical protein A2927_00880 [Candidatus Komeilibacteria bacterium RIFCSPLOWO2_01_FULL_45_10]|uniref:Cell division protein FtsL n=1 Tax=Candidatus Komeilibacteria bacterium RIFCSPLOWO2_01_FULL_45_10 TaxID=1798550 RepID=A0A1G2BMP0_9BACT|nr:MAG: hypothetical protein A2927_00880 [Candidatus Komeilibacteria bacterium RIFCSPLOWO2_01_FULL_45_10]